MKRVIYILSFLIPFSISNAQFSTSIESIRKEFHALSLEADRIIHPYDSLISRRNELKMKLNYEIQIYKECETAFQDKMRDLGVRGDRHQKKLILHFRNMELKKEEMENSIVFAILAFNHWNTTESGRVRSFYESYADMEKEKLRALNQELIKYVNKIHKLQNEADKAFVSYDSCRRNCRTACDCDELYVKYEKSSGLAEKYMIKYCSILDQQKAHNYRKQEKHLQYRESYDNYFAAYKEKKSEVAQQTERLQSAIKEIDGEIRNLADTVYKQVYAAMEKDIMDYNRETVNEIREINNLIVREFGSITFYNHLKDMQRLADIMVTTLNPEMNFISVLDIIAGYDKNQLPEEGDGEKLRNISLRYGDILDKLKTAIRSYDAIPYFCLNAYPQYSNEVVDENLDIIDTKLALTDASLESRTRKFLNVSELDLSDTNFSLDLVFKGHDNIEKLDLSNTPVSSVKYLSGTNIRWLDLSNTNLERSDLEYIKRMKNIEYLDLSNTGLKKKDIHDVCFHLKVKRRNCKTE